jgi:hypothetical protein
LEILIALVFTRELVGRNPLSSILATGLLVVQILGGKFPLAVCEKEVIMLL